jgi:hypothetical protein
VECFFDFSTDFSLVAAKSTIQHVTG